MCVAIGESAVLVIQVDMAGLRQPVCLPETDRELREKL